MLDQTFTAANFRRVFDHANRKGFDVAGTFFPSLEPYTNNVREKMKEIKKLRIAKDTLTKDEFDSRLAVLRKELLTLKETKSAAIDQLLHIASSNTLKSTFKITLTKKAGPKGKDVYCIDGTPETFLVIKQLQSNINKIYQVKQSNRHELVCKLRDTINSRMPLEIVRTDISTFYETIDRKRLLAKLDTDQLLSSSSRKYIKQTLDSYGSLTGQSQGIPRGVGISAYLAELYLRPLDKAVQELPGMVLYCRYVDDIVAVFARPPAGDPVGSYEDAILKIIDDYGLKHNADKTSSFKTNGITPKKFEYLGYRFFLQSENCKVSPSARKIIKYKKRMKAAFSAYDEIAPIQSRKAYRELVSRIKFLTGNTRLSNSKSGAATGIYYNNPIATDLSSLSKLDKALKIHIKKISRPKLRKRLKNCSFVHGFSERRFHNFSTRELQMIVRAWKHV